MLTIADQEVQDLRVRDARARRRRRRRRRRARAARAGRARGAGAARAPRGAALTRHGGVRRLRAVTPTLPPSLPAALPRPPAPRESAAAPLLPRSLLPRVVTCR